MPKIRPEKISGIVALSYLFLIPAGAAWALVKIRAMDADIETLWRKANVDPALAAEVPSLARAREAIMETARGVRG